MDIKFLPRIVVAQALQIFHGEIIFIAEMADIGQGYESSCQPVFMGSSGLRKSSEHLVGPDDISVV